MVLKRVERPQSSSSDAESSSDPRHHSASSMPQFSGRESSPEPARPFPAFVDCGTGQTIKQDQNNESTSGPEGHEPRPEAPYIDTLEAESRRPGAAVPKYLREDLARQVQRIEALLRMAYHGNIVEGIDILRKAERKARFRIKWSMIAKSMPPPHPRYPFPAYDLLGKHIDDLLSRDTDVGLHEPVSRNSHHLRGSQSSTQLIINGQLFNIDGNRTVTVETGPSGTNICITGRGQSRKGRPRKSRVRSTTANRADSVTPQGQGSHLRQSLRNPAVENGAGRLASQPTPRNQGSQTAAARAREEIHASIIRASEAATLAREAIARFSELGPTATAWARTELRRHLGAFTVARRAVRDGNVHDMPPFLAEPLPSRPTRNDHFGPSFRSRRGPLSPYHTARYRQELENFFRPQQKGGSRPLRQGTGSARRGNTTRRPVSKGQSEKADTNAAHAEHSPRPARHECTTSEARGETVLPATDEATDATDELLSYPYEREV